MRNDDNRSIDTCCIVVTVDGFPPRQLNVNLDIDGRLLIEILRWAGISNRSYFYSVSWPTITTVSVYARAKKRKQSWSASRWTLVSFSAKYTWFRESKETGVRAYYAFTPILATASYGSAS